MLGWGSKTSTTQNISFEKKSIKSNVKDNTGNAGGISIDISSAAGSIVRACFASRNISIVYCI